MPFPPDQPLARFIFDRNHVRADGRLRPQPFKPKRGDTLSLYDIGGLDHAKACEHGHRYADDPIIVRVHFGYGELHYQVVVNIGLMAEYDNDPPRHVSVRLPEIDEQRLEVAKALAGAARLKYCK